MTESLHNSGSSKKDQKRFLRAFKLAATVKEFSGAPFKVGAIIATSDLSKLAIGYNGLPSRCYDNTHGSRYAVHAELNALLKASWFSSGSLILASTYFPCFECAKMIVQVRAVETVIAPSLEKLAHQDLDRFKRYGLMESANFLRNCGVRLFFV